jgi:predicted nucleic acid-binding Zn ribbon protein
MSKTKEEKKHQKIKLYIYRTVIIAIVVVMMILSLLQM